MKARGLAIFDLDGVLVELSPPLEELEALRARLLDLAKHNGLVRETRSILGTYRRMGRELGFDHQVSQAARDLIDEYETAWTARLSEPRPGVEAISRLPGAGILAGLVTNNGRACVEALFQSGLLSGAWFEAVVTRDDALDLKPSPEPLVRMVDLVQAGSADIDRIWFAGDSPSDREAAEAFNRLGGRQIEFVPIGRPENLTKFLARLLD